MPLRYFQEMNMNINRKKLLNKVFVGVWPGLLTLWLSGCGVSKPIDEVLDTAGLGNLVELQGLNRTPLFKPAGKNCPADDFDIPGQGYRAQGSSGGLAVLTEPPYTKMPTAVGSPQSVGTNIYTLANSSASGIPKNNVTILVVDDFNGDVARGEASVYQLGADVFALPGLGLPKKLSLRLSELDKELGRLETTKQISHGAVVINHINALIMGTGQYTLSKNAITNGEVEFRHIVSSQFIKVRAVDTEDLDTDAIMPNMQAAILGALAETNRVVVNMSFSIVPCNVKDDFAANRATFPSFELYSNAVALANSALKGSAETQAHFLKRVRQALITPMPNDLVHDLITDAVVIGVGEEQRLIYVAAAGNFGLTFSMYPAAWENVLSTSANNFGTRPVKSAFSNYGEIMMTGSWFRLTNPAGINGPFLDAPSVVYAGTSYAAPDLTVFSALDLSLPTPHCDLPQTRVGSELDHADFTNPLFDNRLLETALSLCN
jgi:hypothetical protein